MSSPNARPSGRRPGRGPRRHGRRRDDSRGPASSTSSPAAKPTEKQSFLQKLIGFFTGKKKSPNGASARPENRRTNYPAYPGKESGKSEARPAASQPAAPSRPARKAEAVEVTTPKVYVGNLSFDATESDLSGLFSGVGTVRNSEVVSHKETEKSKGFGFVTMSTTEEAKRAVEVLHDKEFMGRKLVVSGAKTPPERG